MCVDREIEFCPSPLERKQEFKAGRTKKLLSKVEVGLSCNSENEKYRVKEEKINNMNPLVQFSARLCFLNHPLLCIRITAGAITATRNRNYFPYRIGMNILSR